MRVLVITPKVPQPDGKGYAIRAAAVIAALERHHEVAVFVPESSLVRRVISATTDMAAGRPAQLGYSMPPEQWQRAVGAAANADVVIATTVRTLRGPLAAPVVLDHVDALSLNWAQRATSPQGLLSRLIAGLEAERLREWERTTAGWSVAQLILTERDLDHVPDSAPVHVVPHVVFPDVPVARRRDIDVVLTGNMRYPPNRAAALWLDREIAPELRRVRPGTRIVVAGRSAQRLRLRTVELMADVPSIPKVLARSKVSIVPLAEIVSGVPTKALEAAICGAALVLTPSAHQRLGLPARIAADAPGLARETAALLNDSTEREALAARALAALAGRGIADVADMLDKVLAGLGPQKQAVAA